MRKVCFLILVGILLFSCTAYAGRVVLAWDPPDISTDVTGYMIHYGAASRQYSEAVDVGNVTSYTVLNLRPGMIYFAVTAYNEAGYQSVYSNEVSILMTPDPFKNINIVKNEEESNEKSDHDHVRASVSFCFGIDPGGAVRQERSECRCDGLQVDWPSMGAGEHPYSGRRVVQA